MYCPELFPLDFHAPLNLSGNIPTEQEVKSVPGQRKEMGFCTIFFYVRAVLGPIAKGMLGKGENNSFWMSSVPIEGYDT